MGGVIDLNGPAEVAEDIDVTSVDDTYKQWIAGVKEGGEIECESLPGKGTCFRITLPTSQDDV